MMTDYEDEEGWAREEVDLLSRLNDAEDGAQRALVVSCADETSAAVIRDYITLIRMYKRKYAEAAEFKEYLNSLKEFFTECWDDEDGVFDPTTNNVSRSEWCPILVTEIEEMTANTTWLPRPVPVKAGI